MRFILKHQQPWLIFAIDIHIDADGACIDLIADVNIGRHSIFTEILGADGRDIHKIDRPALSLLSVNIPPCRQVTLKSFLHSRLRNAHIINRRQKSRMPAVI